MEDHEEAASKDSADENSLKELAVVAPAELAMKKLLKRHCLFVRIASV